MHPVKAGPELGLRPTFRTVPAALCCLSGFACVRCLTYLSKDVSCGNARDIGAPCRQFTFGGGSARTGYLRSNGRNRRISPTPARPGEGLLSDHIAGVRPVRIRPANSGQPIAFATRGSARDGRKRRVPCGRLRAQVAFGLRTRHCKTSASCIGICDSEDESYFGLQG